MYNLFKQQRKSPYQRQSQVTKPQGKSFLSYLKYSVPIIVVLGIILLLVQRYTLSDTNTNLPVSSESQEIQPVTIDETPPVKAVIPRFSSSKNPTEGESGESGESGSNHDLYLGPVKLEGSSHIVERIDQADQELNAHNTTLTQREEGVQVDWNDLITHPIDTIIKVNSSLSSSWHNNSRRTTLIKLVDSVSRYYIAYNKFPFPETSVADAEYEWIREMVEKREMSGVYQYVLETTSPVSYCGAVNQTGYCYKTDGYNAVIYVRLEKPIGREVCAEDGVFFLWSSEDNKLGSVCLQEEPSKLGGFTYFRY